MKFSIDPGSPVAPFEQLRVLILDAVRSGELAAGAKLPTVRGLAADLGVAPNTVARAYRELEADELLETRGRNGTFVAASGDAATRGAQAAAAEFAARIEQLRVDPREALALVTSALAQLPR